MSSSSVFGKHENKDLFARLTTVFSAASFLVPLSFCYTHTEHHDQCNCLSSFLTLLKDCWAGLEKTTHMVVGIGISIVRSLSLVLGNHSGCPWLVDFPISQIDILIRKLWSHFLLLSCENIPDCLLWMGWSGLRFWYHCSRIIPNLTEAKSAEKPELWTLDKCL